MVRGTYFSTTELVVQTNRGSKGRQSCHQVHQVKAKKGNKGEPGVDVYNKIVYFHKELAEKMHKIHSEVDSNISKFYNGTTPWSPQIQTH